MSIVTPSYNRGELLLECYESLKKQTNKNFEWIIVDDGSIDKTKEIVDSFINEKKINIKYLYKENGGKHTAWNLGVKNCSGELTFILDSDDTIVENAIDIIWGEWEKWKLHEGVKVMSFLRIFKDGNVIGEGFPHNGLVSNYTHTNLKLGIKGDKSEVFVTTLLKKYKFPEIKGEKFLGEDVVLVRIAREYKTVHLNKATYITEYLEGGLTKSGRKLRIKSPIGGMIRSKEIISENISLKLNVKHMMLYTCYGLFAKKSIFELKNESINKKIFILSLPLSLFLYKYWNYKYID